MSHILFQNTVPFMRYVEKFGTARQATDDNVVQHLHVARWTIEATHIQNNTAFLWQQWLLQCAPMLHYMYTVYLLVS